jgi:coenzyme F420-reducing hydrogenase beta subunit
MTAELSDVSIGDAWGFEGVERGLSLFVARREVGIEALKLALSRGLIEMRDVSPEEVVRSQRYLWIKKRGFVSGRRKIMGSAYHAIQVVGSSMSKSQWSAPLLRAWVRLLVARPYSLARH